MPPATSCHLRYGHVLPEWVRTASEWTLECSVKVHKSTPCTYFCVCGFGPGGYCGIQELKDGQRKAIFSLWNTESADVELVEAHPDTEVAQFGGEGTGIRTMMLFPWEEDDLITFKISARRIESHWVCSCRFFHNGGSTEIFMATLKRHISGGQLLYRGGFYSFIEDWDRHPSNNGHLISRRAEFLNPKLNGTILDNATFTKVETGADAYAVEHARGWRSQFCGQVGYTLQTGMESHSENPCVAAVLNNTPL